MTTREEIRELACRMARFDDNVARKVMRYGADARIVLNALNRIVYNEGLNVTLREWAKDAVHDLERRDFE